jgi:glycosyltransferase involved in cell wall biosynthesis
VNPEDVEELAEAMMRVLSDDSLQSQLRSRGLERAKQFTWQRAAQQTLAVYREIVNNQR